MTMPELFRHVKRDADRDADDWRSVYSERKRARLEEELDTVKKGQTLTEDVGGLKESNMPVGRFSVLTVLLSFNGRVQKSA